MILSFLVHATAFAEVQEGSLFSRSRLSLFQSLDQLIPLREMAERVSDVLFWHIAGAPQLVCLVSLNRSTGSPETVRQ